MKPPTETAGETEKRFGSGQERAILAPVTDDTDRRVGICPCKYSRPAGADQVCARTCR